MVGIGDGFRVTALDCRACPPLMDTSLIELETVLEHITFQ